MDWKQIENVINDFTKNESIIDDYDECEHDIIEIDGYRTCQICGSVLSQIFKTVNVNDHNFVNDYDFKEDKQKTKTRYSQINEIKIKFMDYVISSQKGISQDDYIKFATEWNNKKYDTITKKYIKECIEACNLDINDFNKYYYIVKNQNNVKSQSTSLNNTMITNILKECEHFIMFYKGKIKNINKRALLYVIARYEYNIYLDDYICLMKEDIIKKYYKMYKKMQGKKKATFNKLNLKPREK